MSVWKKVKAFQALQVINKRPRNPRHYFEVQNYILKKTNTELSTQTISFQRKIHKRSRSGGPRYDHKCHKKV